MPAIFHLGRLLCWAVVRGYWAITALRAKQVTRSESRTRQFLAYWLPLIIAMILLGPGHWFGHSWLREQFVPHSLPIYTLGLLLCVAGAALALWSRWQLGRNWSGNVQIKQAHELISSGPYAHVRNPIYSGFLLMFSGTALMVGDWRGVIAVVIVFASFWVKLRQEERFLSAHFGPAYSAYAARTKRLIPGLL